MHNDASLRCFRAGVIFIVIGLSISILFLLSQRLFVDLYRAFGFSRMVSRYRRSWRFQGSLLTYTVKGYMPQPLMQINFLMRTSSHPPRADKSAVCTINRHLRWPDCLVNGHQRAGTGIVQIIFIAGLKFTIPGQKTLDFYKLY